MPKIYLVRHADYANPRGLLAGRLPMELSELGRQQAQELHEVFAGKNISKIYSSAVMRCKQTSEAIAAGTIQIIYDQRLLESLSAYQGYWEANWHETGFHAYSHRGELGGENLQDIQARMAAFWDEITPGLQENIIICGHGDPLQQLYNYVHHLPPIPENVVSEGMPGWLEKGAFLEL